MEGALNTRALPAQSQDDFAMALAEGAMAKSADAMDVCLKGQLKKAKTNFEKASDVQLDRAFLHCDSKALAAFEKAGGVSDPTPANRQMLHYPKRPTRLDDASLAQSKDDFAMALAEGAMAKSADAMDVCLKAQLKKAKTSFEKASDAQLDRAFLHCESKAQAAFEKAGGVRGPIIFVWLVLQLRDLALVRESGYLPDLQTRDTLCGKPHFACAGQRGVRNGEG